jgi:hypothetical protein
MSEQIKLLCVVENHGVQGLFVEEGRDYGVYQDNYGQFIEDSNGDEHYLTDFDWEKIFTKVN